MAGATLLTGVTGVAIAEDVDGLLLALPLMVGVLALFAMRSMVEILALGGYRKAIEDSIAATTGAPIVLWERSIVPTFNSSIAVRAMHGLYATGYTCGLVGAAFVLNSIDATPLGYIGYAVATLILTVVLVASLLAVSRAADRAYEVASNGLAALRHLYAASSGDERRSSQS